MDVGSGRMSRCNVALWVTSLAREVMVIVIAEVTVPVGEGIKELICLATISVEPP